MHVAVLDGYIDEPSVFGVPPYMAPYPRLVVGAVKDAGHEATYLTIDQVRRRDPAASALGSADVLAVVGGNTVPGKYIRTLPASSRELRQLADASRGTTILGGTMGRYAALATDDLRSAFDHVAARDLDTAVHDLLRGGSFRNRARTPAETERWLCAGAAAVRQHPDFPDPLIAEVLLYPGCIRVATGGCSFCTEISWGNPTMRPVEDVLREMEALAAAGVRNFRVTCACILSYHAERIATAPVPSVDILRQLFSGIRDRIRFSVLHTDNCDPAMIVRDPGLGKAAVEIVARGCTGGNVLSFGLESADPEVHRQNNLNAGPDEVRDAVRIVNRIGGARSPTGLPWTLPGINFLSGLYGESAETFERNLAFLRGIRDEGLLLRRINLRQVLSIRREYHPERHRRQFLRFKKQVREEIDRPLLRALLPEGTVLPGLYTEYTQGNLAYARQVGSYPVLVGIPTPAPAGPSFSAVVVDHGFRSVTAVPAPLDLNRASMRQLAAIPGVGRKRAARIVRHRPYRSPDAVAEALDDPAVAGRIRALASVAPGGGEPALPAP